MKVSDSALAGSLLDAHLGTIHACARERNAGIVPFHRKHLQEIPDQSGNISTSFTWGWDSSKTSELLSGMGVSALEKEEVDSENIPQELLSNVGHPQSPPRKRLKSKGNEKDFVIIRRPKLNRENLPGRLQPWEDETVA